MGADHDKGRYRMTNLFHWLSMSGYAAYIWSAYGLTVLVLFCMWRLTKYQHKRLFKRLVTRVKCQ